MWLKFVTFSRNILWIVVMLAIPQCLAPTLPYPGCIRCSRFSQYVFDAAKVKLDQISKEIEREPYTTSEIKTVRDHIAKIKQIVFDGPGETVYKYFEQYDKIYAATGRWSSEDAVPITIIKVKVANLVEEMMKIVTGEQDTVPVVHYQYSVKGDARNILSRLIQMLYIITQQKGTTKVVYKVKKVLQVCFDGCWETQVEKDGATVHKAEPIFPKSDGKILVGNVVSDKNFFVRLWEKLLRFRDDGKEYKVDHIYTAHQGEHREATDVGVHCKFLEDERKNEEQLVESHNKNCQYKQCKIKQIVKEAQTLKTTVKKFCSELMRLPRYKNSHPEHPGNTSEVVDFKQTGFRMEPIMRIGTMMSSPFNFFGNFRKDELPDGRKRK